MIYIEEFKDRGYTRPGPSPDANPTSIEFTEHVHWMCYEVIRLNKHEAVDREKVMRWLGFVQGYLASSGLFTIEQMKEHNR